MMLFKRTFQETEAVLKDKYLIQELISFERYCRDQKHWSEMKKCFDEKSMVNISWYNGSGWGFVEASEKMETSAPHKINNILVWLNGHQAVAECIACVLMRVEIEGNHYDLTSYVRLHYKLIKKSSGDWFIFELTAIYEKDTLIPMFPVNSTANLGEAIKKNRPSYANLTYVLSGVGHEINDSLPGEDRPDLIEALYKKSEQWLNG